MGSAVFNPLPGILAALLFGTASFAGAPDAPDTLERFGDWSVARHIAGCEASVLDSFEGYVLHVVVARDTPIRLLLRNRSWAFEAGPVRGFQLVTDRGRHALTGAEAEGALVFDVDAALLETLRRDSAATVTEYETPVGHFSLKGSADALRACGA